MIEMYDDEGREWVERLPALLADCAERWQLGLGSPFALSYNYVTSATRADGTPVVLKVGFPGRELFTEMSALRIYDGRGIARLLDADEERGAMLLERLLPGTTLSALRAEDDERATRIAAEVMGKLWQPLPPDHSFPSTADWAKGMQRLRDHYNGGTGPFAPQLVELAERLFVDLLASSAPPVLLHGDLHHDNILQAEREPWLALDPKGLAGEPAYEVGALLRNPLPQLLREANPKAMQEQRVAILAEMLGIERERILGWAIAQGVLSSWWMVEDQGYGWEDTIICTEMLVELL